MRLAPRSVILCCGLLLLAASGPGAQAQPVEEPDQPESQEQAAPRPPVNVKIPLVRHLRMVIRPTILGLVPPDDDEHLGEVFVRVTEILPGWKLTARFEIKERGIWERTAAEEAADVAPKRRRPAVRFRRGFFTARGSGEGPPILPPLLWGDGDFESAGGVLWLPPEMLQRLKSGGEVDWDPAFGDPVLAADLERLSGVAEDTVKLELRERQVRYPVDVNGRRSWLSAVSATDSLGAAEYVILDDADNPLVLKLSFAGEGLPDAGGKDGGGLATAGAGYAVVSLDF